MKLSVFVVLASVLQSAVFVVLINHGVDLEHFRYGNKMEGFADAKDGD